MPRVSSVCGAVVIACHVATTAQAGLLAFDEFDTGPSFHGTAPIGLTGGTILDTQYLQQFTSSIQGELSRLEIGRLYQGVDDGPLEIVVREAGGGAVVQTIVVPYADVSPTPAILDLDSLESGNVLHTGTSYEILLRMLNAPSGDRQPGYRWDALDDGDGFYLASGESGDGGATFLPIENAHFELRVYVRPIPPAGNGLDPSMLIWESRGPNIAYEIDMSIPDAINPVTQNTADSFIGSFESANGVYYVPSSTFGSTNKMFVMDPATGDLLDTILLQFPFTGDGLTSVEYAEGTMYGGMREGALPFTPSYLVTIDLDTGLVSQTGPMGILNQTGGLAYHDGTMYTVNTGSQDAILYTVDLDLGLATAVGDVIDVDSALPIKLTGLEFGRDGLLYGLGRGPSGSTSSDPFNDVIYQIDPAFGYAFKIGKLPALDDGASTLSTAISALDTCRADLDDDGDVDGIDLGLLLGNWGDPGDADLNNSGATDGADLGLFLGAWGACP
ncbi:MAG: hypothetical protein ACF8GE_01295 [Phycisphaerales bacterium JB043]